MTSESSLSPRSAPRKPATKSSAGWASSSCGRRALDEPAARPEDRDPVAQAYRFVDVVGDEDDGLVHLRLESSEFVLQLGAHDGVDRAERLVHQEHRRVGGERAGHADALLLAAGELVRVALAGVGGSSPTRSSIRGRAATRALAPSPAGAGTVAMLSSDGR